jgi:4-hydroxybenzoyl-CoA thioesterase
MKDAPAVSVIAPWSTTVAIRFSHCDPASIVYFASHFDILNGVMEDWFIEALGIDYHHVVGVRRVGLGYAHASCDFAAPARMGDRLAYAVGIERIGNKSITVRIIATRESTKVLVASLVIVTTDLDRGVSVPVPDDIRAALTAYLERQS